MHSVFEEVAANSVLDLDCSHQMRLIIRDSSEELFQRMEDVPDSRRFLWTPPVTQEKAE